MAQYHAYVFIALNVLIVREQYRLKSVPENTKTDRQITKLSG